jgi:hypothetical protein
MRYFLQLNLKFFQLSALWPILVIIQIICISPAYFELLKTRNETAVNNFRDYLRINTSHPNPDYGTEVITA